MPGGRDHVLLHHRAAHVVAAELERHLPDLRALRHPGGLDVGEVVEDRGARRPCVLQVDEGARRTRGPCARGSCAASGTATQMNAVKPCVSSWSARRRSRCSMRSASVSTCPYIIVADVFEPLPMRLPHHAEPLVGRGLERRDDLAHAIDEDLGAAARHGARARPAMKRRRISATGIFHVCGEVRDLGRREAVDVDLGIAHPDVAEQVLVPVDPEVGVVAALEQHLPTALGAQFLQPRADLLVASGRSPRRRPARGRRRRRRSTSRTRCCS